MYFNKYLKIKYKKEVRGSGGEWLDTSPWDLLSGRRTDHQSVDGRKMVEKTHFFYLPPAYLGEVWSFPRLSWLPCTIGLSLKWPRHEFYWMAWHMVNTKSKVIKVSLWASFPECINILAALAESWVDSWDQTSGSWPICNSSAPAPAGPGRWHQAQDFTGHPLLG